MFTISSHVGYTDQTIPQDQSIFCTFHCNGSDRNYIQGGLEIFRGPGFITPGIGWPGFFTIRQGGGVFSQYIFPKIVYNLGVLIYSSMQLYALEPQMGMFFHA